MPLPPVDGPAVAPVSRFVVVDGARLHVLDWGGSGPPLVFVPGAGASGWIYSDLAPELTDGWRVLAIAPRGHGISDSPDGRLTLARCAADVIGALEAMEIGEAVFVVHSLAGHVVTQVAVARPELVSALIYLDAMVDYAGWLRMRALDPHRPPPPEQAGQPDRAWLERYSYGFWHDALDADLRAVPDDPAAPTRARIMTDLMEDAVIHPPRYADVRAPVLAVAAVESMRDVWPWIGSLDAAAQAKGMAFMREVRGPFKRSTVDRFRRSMPHAKVVEITGHHFVFLTSRDAVLREIRAFLPLAGQEVAA